MHGSSNKRLVLEASLIPVPVVTTLIADMFFHPRSPVCFQLEQEMVFKIYRQNKNTNVLPPKTTLVNTAAQNIGYQNSLRETCVGGIAETLFLFLGYVIYGDTYWTPSICWLIWPEYVIVNEIKVMVICWLWLCWCWWAWWNNGNNVYDNRDNYAEYDNDHYDVGNYKKSILMIVMIME